MDEDLMDNMQRRDQIFLLLESHEQMSVEELAARFNVTETTIRRDLIVMEEKKQIVRKRGYAMIPNSGYSMAIRRRNINQDEKKRIAVKAFEICRNANSIALDSGTTISELVHLLIDHRNEFRPEIVTCSLTTAYNTCQYFHTSIPGGLVFPDEVSCAGPFMSDFFNNITTDVVFLGSTGVSNTRGLTGSYQPMLDVKRSLMKCASRRVGLIDSSKFYTRGVYTFCTFTELDVLITVRTEQNAKALDEIEKHNVQIILA